MMVGNKKTQKNQQESLFAAMRASQGCPLLLESKLSCFIDCVEVAASLWLLLLLLLFFATRLFC